MSGVTERRLRCESGFSLVELSVTVAVLGIMAALAFPSLKGVMPRIRLDNNTMILVNEINLVRRHAIAKSSGFKIVFNSGAGSYTLMKWDGATSNWQSMGVNKMEGIRIIPDPNPPYGSIAGFSSPDTLIAEATGALNVPLVVGGNVNFGYITLQTPDGSLKKRVKVEQLGRISVQRWQNGNWVDG